MQAGAPIAVLAAVGALLVGQGLARASDDRPAPAEYPPVRLVQAAEARSAPPPVNREKHNVPLDKVVFDTFNGSFVRLSEASPRTIARLRDAIRPIYKPRYEGPGGGAWLDPDDLVIGIAGEDGAFAYPLKILNFHEIVNDRIGGIPVLISYCPLCASGIVYDRRLEGQVLEFGNTSALYENDMVMYDHQTGSYWFQVGGEGIVGELTGKRLTLLPSATVPWKTWLANYPETRVLSREQGFGRNYPYGRDSFRNYPAVVDRLRFSFPFSREKLDKRLRPAAIVLAVRVAGQEKAYPLNRAGAAMNDTLKGEPVVVFSAQGSKVGAAFSARLGGRTLTFSTSKGGGFRDQQTGSRWTLTGRAVEGPLAGQRLKALPTRRAFWFSLAIALPDVELFQP